MKLSPSKSWDEKLIFLETNFVKRMGLFSFWKYLLYHKNWEISQEAVSEPKEKCAFQLIEIPL